MTSRKASRAWLVGYYVVRAVAFTVLGLLLLRRPDDTVRDLARLIGLILLTLGSLDVVAAAVGGSDKAIRMVVLLRGVVTAGLGALLASLTDATITVVAILVGMQLAVGGGVSILLGVWTRDDVRAWRGIVFRGVITALAGAVVIAWPQKSVAAVAVILGVQWILSGFLSTAVAVVVGSRRSAT